jgi:hypothetical protein
MHQLSEAPSISVNLEFWMNCRTLFPLRFLRPVMSGGRSSGHSLFSSQFFRGICENEAMPKQDFRPGEAVFMATDAPGEP